MGDKQTALDVVDLAYSFKKHRALNGVSFKVDAQSIHGFVGPNGAGKTTALKCVATLLVPQSGRIQVFGHDVVRSARSVRRSMGFMPDHLSMYKQMTVFEYLDFFAAAYGQSLAKRNRAIADVLALTDMDGRRDTLIKGLSRGMQQRVSLARVLVHDPDLLLLDEPASGLDPRARIELMAILRELCHLGKTIFISSHILSELATLCDAVTIIDRGQIRYCGPMSGLLEQKGGTTTYDLVVDSRDEGLEAALRAVEGVLAVTSDDGQPRYEIRFDAARADAAAILGAALEAEAQVVSFNRGQRQFNDVFMDLTKPGVRT